MARRLGHGVDHPLIARGVDSENKRRPLASEIDIADLCCMCTQFDTGHRRLACNTAQVPPARDFLGAAKFRAKFQRSDVPPDNVGAKIQALTKYNSKVTFSQQKFR